MKKIIIALLMCCPLMCAAQSEWEAPVTKKNNEAKELKDTAKKSNKADSKEATLAVKDINDWKYIQIGGVTEVVFKVFFSLDIVVIGTSEHLI